MRLILLVSIIVLVASVSSVRADCPAIPECVSGLCFRINSLDDLPSEDRVRKLTGSARKATASSMPDTRYSYHLISTPKHKVLYVGFIFIEVESMWRLITITVSSQKLCFMPKEFCSDPEVLSVDFEFLTEKKIGIGSGQDDVISAHGEPKYFLSPPPVNVIKNSFPYVSKSPADTIIQYVAGEDEGLHSRFYLMNGKVIGIELSAAP